MAKLSHIIVANPQVERFEGLRELVILVAQTGEIFLEFDVKPDYPDTPRDWHMQLETAFYWGERQKKQQEAAKRAEEMKKEMKKKDAGS